MNYSLDGWMDLLSLNDGQRARVLRLLDELAG
jgi:hypothetical protein